MKTRTACLAALSMLAPPLMFCMGSPPPTPQIAKSLAAADAGSAGASIPVLAKHRSSIRPATFPHERHANELGIECSQCHHETNAQPLSIPHQNYFDDMWIDCGICHHKAGAAALEPQACWTCHHAGNGDLGDETLSAKVVIHKNCWSCHEVGTGAKASTACKGCHTPGS